MKIVPSYWDEDLELMSPETLEEIRLQKMQKHLRYAYQNSPFYKRAFDLSGFRPEEIRDLEDFSNRVPLLTHMQMVRNQVENPPFGDFLSMGLRDVSGIYCSTGPLMMPFSTGDMDSYIITTANGLYVCGARGGDIVDVTVAHQWRLAGNVIDSAFRRIGCAVVPGGPGMAKFHINVMKRLGVTILFAFPSFAMRLAHVALGMGINPLSELKVRLIILGTDVYSDYDREMLAGTFGAEIREMYGGEETGFVAAECPYGGGMHCFTDSILEVVDPATGKWVETGEAGEIVTTDLSRRAMPVIRYRTGDLTGGLNLDGCPCGRTSPRLRRLQGRTGDIVRVKGIHLIPEKVEEIISRKVGLGKHQILIDRHSFQERVIIRVESDNLDHIPIRRRELVDNLREVTQLTVEIDFVPKGTIHQKDPVVVDNRLSSDDASLEKDLER